MIEVQKLGLHINKHVILSEVDLTLQHGKIYGLVGNNGSGKTMLMKCICGFIRPTTGKILADKKEVGKEVDYLPNAGVIIENPGFLGYYSGIKNLRLLAKMNHVIGDNEIKTAMRRCGLEPESRLAVKKYSLGMRQRLAIAQATMENQSCLILDEPMNGLDRQGVEDVSDLLLQLKEQGKLILLASHNKADIDVLCDEVYEMESGHIKRLY